MQRLAKHLESKLYISAMIQPVPKSKKERKSISRQINLAISSPPATTEYLKWSDQPVRFSRADHLMTHKYRGSQQSLREVKPKFIDSTQGEPKNIYKP
jgi:hypothetical protein